ncbi:coiled-coil domain-containing protein 172 [Parambassis ranga]|uniref:Coiled-coil domain-containing protein 172 n=1 Tax=Parambassis ranga TaxID=210632 RepID=A0A6P7JWE2_9TELE|nr:coiled-coil domain-containing protein 172 [Parambassis ranga]
MSLDALFQQILITEQRLTGRTQQLKDVKIAIIRCNEKIKSATEKYEKTAGELDIRNRQLSASTLQYDLSKKREDQMLKKIEELLCQQKHLKERLAKIKKESKEDEENFLQEITKFNSDFSLKGNRETLFQSQTHTELLDLEREAESLYKEMELMKSSNTYMRSIVEEKRALLLELQGLDDTEKDLDWQLSEAKAMTQSLQAESLFVSQKPLTDSTCQRLKKELEQEMCKGAELERLQETLGSEIHLLQAKLKLTDSSQGHARPQE